MVAERREDRGIHTERPVGRVANEILPTVREVIALDAVAQGVPEVLVGDEALDARVRWLHVSDSAGVARLLDGGEILLTTGSAWPTSDPELRAFVSTLADAGVAGVVLELGTHLDVVPPAVLETAADRGLALIVLHREVKFVTLTEAVHERIISGQTEALRARDEVRERFTMLALRGSPADFIVQQLAQTLAAPVVLENRAHEVICAEVPLALQEELFTEWELRSRSAHRRVDQRRENGRDAGRGRVARRACRGPRHPVGPPGAAAGARAPRGALGRARAGRDRARRRDGSPTATATSGAGSAAVGSWTDCSRGGSPAPAERLPASKPQGCRCAALSSSGSRPSERP